MSAGERRRLVQRLLGVAAVIAGLAAAVYLLFSSGDGYRVTATFQNASQIVPGNQVRVGGVPVGSVEEVRLSGANEAELVLEIDGDFAPLHEGSKATIRSTSLASIAGRSISLTPGPNDATEIPDGGRIPSEDTAAAVDLDQLLNALDPQTVDALRKFVQGSATAFEDRGEQANAAIEYLNPALAQSSAALDELTSDQPALRQLLRETSGVVETLAERRAALAEGTSAGSTALGALASEREAIASTLSQAPDTLRQANTTLVNLRATLRDIRPAIPEARPVARGLARLLPRLRPLAGKLRREIPDVRALLRSRGPRNDLYDLLGVIPPLRDAGTPVVRDTVTILRQAQPIVDELRPYVPELTSGLVAGFAGSWTGYYDGNGQYARIGFIGGPFSLNNAGQLVPKPPSQFGTGFQRGVLKRCPGGAIYPARDRSNPFTDKGQLVCDPSLPAGRP